jgi:hypothetical protein
MRSWHITESLTLERNFRNYGRALIEINNELCNLR